MDKGRLADIARCDRVIMDPKASDALRKKAEEAKYQILQQQKFRTIKRGREKLAEATRAGAGHVVERESELMHKAFS